VAKLIVIIGAGMGGLSAGCYGQINGYQTQIFEQHTLPGGQCTSWKRKGYTFDVCFHHVFGCSSNSKIYRLWQELGVMPRELVRTEDCTSVLSPDGKLFIDYYDLNKLEEQLLKLSPADAKPIKDYINAIKLFVNKDVMGEMIMGSPWSFLGTLATRPAALKYFTLTMKKFAQRFSDPFLKKAFPLLVYSNPDSPMFLHLIRHAYGLNGVIQWPVSGAGELARSMEKHYLALGGTVHYRSKVAKILVENEQAVGIKLTDGSEHRADYVISNGDGRKTIMDLLEGKYLDEKTRVYCKEPAEETNWGVHVFLGVNRDLSQEPSSLIMLLDEPAVIANHKNESLEMQIYGFDKTMAPPGKGTIKVELISGWSYWKQLYADKLKYEAEKQKIARQVIDIIEKRFPGIKNQVEVIDVTTLMTMERYLDRPRWLNLNKSISTVPWRPG
jgi:phytoene dehydrogenase-like protein